MRFDADGIRQKILALFAALLLAPAALAAFSISTDITTDISVEHFSTIRFDRGALELIITEPGLQTYVLEFSVTANFPYTVESYARDELRALPGWSDSVALKDGQSGAAGETSIWILTITAQADHNGEYVVSGEYEGDISLRVRELPAQ